jgi:aspartate/methionine/tyrosine aminotransferase
VSFSATDINLKALRSRAYNLRWATLPEDVIPLTAADPDFSSAPEIAHAIKQYADERVFSYGPAEGLPGFRKAIASTLQQRKHIVTNEQLVLPVDSAAQGMFIIAKYCLQPGEEAIVFDPVDFLFKAAVDNAGGVAKLLPIDVTTGVFDIDLLETMITPSTKMLCLCNPLNPIGKVFSRNELLAIGNLAVKYNLWIMNDEIWSDIIFPEASFVSVASLDAAIAARTITVYGFSKSFGMAGLRVGFIVSPNADVHEGLLQVSQMRTTAYGVSTLSQVAGQAAFEHAWYWVDAFLEHLTAMRNYSVERLNAMPGITCHLPQGCYLVFPNITGTGMTSTEFASFCMEKAKVAVVPGAARWFGPGAEGHIRICISTSKAVLEEGLNRIEQALQKRL